jgi:PAS domain S-box-containing protein
MQKEAMGHAALWLLGLVGIGFGAGRLERQVREQRRVEKALRESEEEYRAIFDSAGDSLLLTELQGRIVDANPRACAAYGYSQRELLELNARDMAHPDHRDRRDRMLADMEGRGEAQMQTVDVRKDGQSVEVEIRGVRLDYKGRPHLLLIVRDVSARVRAEAERRQLESQLLHLQKMEAIGTLAGGVAHDLNNILSGIVGYPDLVLRQVPEASPLRKPIRIIQKSGQKAADIVQSLLALASRGTVDTEVVNLNAIATELLQSPEMDQLRTLHPSVRFETRLDPSLLNLEGSPAQLSKALMNLLSHAAEAMPGGGRALVSTSNRYLDRSVEVIGYEEAREGEYVVLQVSDTGLALAPQDLERIFEPFYTKRVLGRGGVGIGMAVVWGTVKDHRGYVDARSAEGEGTTYTLYFPATRQEASERQPQLSLDDCAGSGESILVVDDMEQQRDLACEMLRQLNYRVGCVASGEEAVELLKSRPMELLVLDMIMDPGIDGLETYRRILERHPGQKAVIVSGYSETDRVREARRLGAGAYVRKPYLLETIGRAVRGELDREHGQERGS